MRRKTLKKIEEKIRLFDLVTLVKLLESLGFKSRDLYFISHFTNASSTSLCEKISFSERSPKVQITVNMGMLHAHTPLPSFMIKWIEEENVEPQKFLRFIGFFNNQLIHEFLRGLSPEKNLSLFPSWRETHYHYLSLLGFESISTLWLIIKGCFPELVVSIEKTSRNIPSSANTLILGKRSLGGTSYIGKRMEKSFSSIKVIFTTEREVSESGKPWPILINLRLYEWIFPILQRTDLHLTIALRIIKKTDQLFLTPNHFLGFERIGYNSEPFQLLLYHGFIRDFEKNTYLASGSTAKKMSHSSLKK